LSNDAKNTIQFGINKRRLLFFDRSKSGKMSFSDLLQILFQKLKGDFDQMDVRIIVDKTSIEFFIIMENSNDRNIFPDKPMEYFSVSKAN
jgi:levanase/fructan beta-fructosidase